MGVKHCSINVILAAVLALICLGFWNYGYICIYVWPTAGDLGMKAEKTDLSWLLIPGFGLFFLIECILNYFLRIVPRAREDLIICPPPSKRLPSI